MKAQMPMAIFPFISADTFDSCLLIFSAKDQGFYQRVMDPRSSPRSEKHVAPATTAWQTHLLSCAQPVNHFNVWARRQNPFPIASEDIFPLRGKQLHREVNMIFKSDVWPRDWTSDCVVVNTEGANSHISMWGAKANQFTVTNSLLHAQQRQGYNSNRKQFCLPNRHHLDMFGDRLYCRHWERVAAFVACCQTLQSSDKTKGSDVTAASAYFFFNWIKGNNCRPAKLVSRICEFMSKALACEMFLLLCIFSHCRGQRQDMSAINEIKKKKNFTNWRKKIPESPSRQQRWLCVSLLVTTI